MSDSAVDTEASIPSTDNDSGAGAEEADYPTVVERDEDPSIVHFSPKGHETPDPSTRN